MLNGHLIHIACTVVERPLKQNLSTLYASTKLLILMNKLLKKRCCLFSVSHCDQLHWSGCYINILLLICSCITPFGLISNCFPSLKVNKLISLLFHFFHVFHLFTLLAKWEQAISSLHPVHFAGKVMWV